MNADHARDDDKPAIPTARIAPGSYTRKQLDDAIKADANYNDRAIPAQRVSAYDRELLGSSEQTAREDVYDRPYAHGAF